MSNLQSAFGLGYVIQDHKNPANLCADTLHWVQKLFGAASLDELVYIAQRVAVGLPREPLSVPADVKILGEQIYALLKTRRGEAFSAHEIAEAFPDSSFQAVDQALLQDLHLGLVKLAFWVRAELPDRPTHATPLTREADHVSPPKPTST